MGGGGSGWRGWAGREKGGVVDGGGGWVRVCVQVVVVGERVGEWGKDMAAKG